MTDRGLSAAFAQKLKAFAAAPLRFPVPLACAALWAGITVAENHSFLFHFSVGDGIFYQLQVFLILGLFLSLSVRLFAESRNWSIIRWLPLTAGALGLLAMIVFLGQQPRDSYESPAFLFMGPGLILLMIVSPFLHRGAENRLIWDFNFQSWTSAAFGLLIALVLAFGMMAVFGALEALFDLNIPGRYYSDIWIVSLSLIWPWQTLAGVPGASCETGEDYCPRWIKYLISWLLVPMALVYLALLYAFAAKIAIQWTLPEGRIGWLVAGFAGFGLAVWHAAHPLRDTGNRLVRLYVRFFHPALFVPIALLAVGVGARVTDYGVTENRYGLMLLTLWLAGIAVHGVVVRAPRLNIAPMSFAALLILASFGPWGAGAVSLRSQLGQLDALLAEAGVLRDGKLSAPAGQVDTELAKRISSVVDYLNDPGKRQALSDHLGDGGIELAADARPVDIVTAMGLDYINRWGRTEYRSWSRPGPRKLDTRGFNSAIWMIVGPEDRQNGSVEPDGPDTRVRARTTGSDLAISTDEHGPAVIDLAPIVEALKRDGKSGYAHEYNDPLMIAEATGNGLRVRVYFTTINVWGTADALKVQDLSFVALVGPDEGP